MVPRPAGREGEHDPRRVPRVYPQLGRDVHAKLHGHSHRGGVSAVPGELIGVYRVTHQVGEELFLTSVDVLPTNVA